ncbi:ImmA/IrrE family metallo-endopeptidase [Staphylococcus hominis]
MTTRIGIEKEVLDWAIVKSNKEYEVIQKKFPKIEEWRLNKTKPTFKQVEGLSSFLNVPFGYLLVDTPPKEDIELLKFRTVNSEERKHTSRELIDTINDMEIKQEWMKEYLVSEGYEKNHIVERLNSNLNPTELAKELRSLIDLPVEWYKESNKSNAFAYLRRKISYNGILVMQNGIVKNNTHRALDVEEFRAFCLIDDYAPLIFINTKDSENGKIFSLLHELVHIGLGIENIYNETDIIHEHSELEAICNKVAAEILVPTDKFIHKWENESLTREKDKIESLSNEFVASKIVLARKALDQKLIDNNLYTEIVDETKKTIEKLYKPKSSGGNAINNAKSRIDTNFAIAVSDGLKSGKALYSDIYKLTGINNKMFNKVIERLEGE